MKINTSKMRLQILIVLLLATLQGLAQAPVHQYSPPKDLKDGIKVSTLKDARIDQAKIEAGTAEILKGTYPNMHSLLIFRRGKLVYENYFTGEDVERGKGKLGVIKHSIDTLHDMRSVTKSVVAMAVLVAHAQGKIKSLDQPVFEFFPEFASHAVGNKKNITLRHVLSMTAGLEWDERIPYTDPKNGEIQMDNAANAIEFVLSRNLTSEPGTEFNYSGGMPQVLASVIKKTTGMEIDSFTEKYLFSPLGIKNYQWIKTKSGDPSAASGLRLRSRDMAKVGLLLMQRGKWNGKQIIPENLADEATKAHIKMRMPPNAPPDVEVNYGFQIWQPSFLVGTERISLLEFVGNGGQTVQIDRANDVMVVVTAGNYNVRSMGKNSGHIYPEIVLPALLDRKMAKSASSK